MKRFARDVQAKWHTMAGGCPTQEAICSIFAQIPSRCFGVRLAFLTPIFARKLSAPANTLGNSVPIPSFTLESPKVDISEVPVWGFSSAHLLYC